MSRGWTPDYAPQADPGQGNVPPDVEPRVVLLAALHRLDQRARAVGLGEHHVVRYTLLATETGLPGPTILYGMQALIAEGLAYSSRNSYGLTPRGSMIAAADISEQPIKASRRQLRLSENVSRKTAKTAVLDALFAAYGQRADRGESPLDARLSLQEISAGCALEPSDTEATLTAMMRTGLVAFTGGWQLSLLGLRYAEAIHKVDLNALLVRVTEGRRREHAGAVSRARGS